jgi:hypothetical protein
MVAAWPPDLPAAPLASGFQETAPVLAARTQMDIGPAKTRRRYTVGVTRWNASFRFTNAQMISFQAFWTDTLDGGIQPFTFSHPRTGNVMTCRIVGEPTYTPLSRGINWQAAMNMELLP